MSELAQQSTGMVYIPDEWVQDHLSLEEAVEVVERVFTLDGQKRVFLTKPSALSLEHGTESNNWGALKVKGALVPAETVAGLRLIGNGAIADPTTANEQHSYCYLVDPKSGTPLALLNENWQHILRTGVTGAVAVHRLARKKDRHRVGIIGAGRIARTTLEALHHLLPIEHVKVTSSRPESRLQYAETMGRRLQVPVLAVDSAREAVKGADIVFTITDANAVLVRSEWIEEGVTLCSLGGHQELDPRFLALADKFIVDDPVWCKMAGDIHAWISNGDVTEAEVDRRIHATIGEICAGLSPARERDDERIVAIIQGMASCDLALAAAVYEKARVASDLQRIVLT